MAGQWGTVTALVRNAVAVGAGLSQDAPDRPVDRNHHAERFAVRGGSDGNSQKILHIEAALSVPAAADDVHHRHGQRGGIITTQILVQR